MIYKYYIEEVSQEHKLYANELAEIYGIYSINGNPHSKLVKNIIIDYMSKNNIEYRPTYYITRNGKQEVFSFEHYIYAFKGLLGTEDYNGVYESLNGLKYKYKYIAKKE